MEISQEKKGKSETHLAEQIRLGNEHAFEQLFFTYFYDLCSFALQMTSSNEQAKDIVQDVFEKLWRRREKLQIRRSLKAYLYKSVRNCALNHLDKRKHRVKVRKDYSRLLTVKDWNFGRSELNNNGELLTQIWKIVLEMPKRRRSVFILHRKHGLSYREIGMVLEISKKTVENHMGLALKEIREQVAGKPA